MLWCVMPGKVTVSCRQVSASALALCRGGWEEGSGRHEAGGPEPPSVRQDSLGRGRSSNQLSSFFLQVHDQDHHSLGCVPKLIATGRSCPGWVRRWLLIGELLTRNWEKLQAGCYLWRHTQMLPNVCSAVPQPKSKEREVTL